MECAKVGRVFASGPIFGLLRRYEPWFVFALALAILLPGVWSYTLVDPWETHYAEVARRMLADGDFVQLTWQNENFDSKPVLTFWLMAAGLKLFGIADGGGYSGEIATHPLTGLAIRFPFVVVGALGLLFTWLMLARFATRRVAWLAFLILASTPYYFFVARQGITDMPLVTCLIGSIACAAVVLARPDGALRAVWRRWTLLHLFCVGLVAVAGGQVLYFFVYFLHHPQLGPGIRVSPLPLLLFPVGAAVASAAVYLLTRCSLSRKSKLITFATAVASAALIIAITHRPLLYAVTRYPGAFVFTGFALLLVGFMTVALPREGGGTRQTLAIMAMFALMAIGILGKGPPAAAITVITTALFLLITRRWDLLGRLATWLDIARGVVVMILIALPWHVAIFLKQGPHWVNVYLRTHIMGRAFSGVHGDRGTFDYYVAQLGIGTWPWMALLPGALATILITKLARSPEATVRSLVATWAIVAFALFSAVQTKFHHYALPVAPALAIIVAFFISDVIDRRVEWVKPLFLLAAALVALVCRDMIYEQKQFIELFVYRHDRPWPDGSPWFVDIGGELFAFGVGFVVTLLAATNRRLRKTALYGLVGLALVFATWAMNGYMGAAAPHWGQRDYHRIYYAQRHIYGVEIEYSSLRDLYDHWNQNRKFEVRSVLPDDLAVDQEVTVTIRVPGAGIPDDRLELGGRVAALGDDTFTIEVTPNEHAKLGELLERGKEAVPSKRRPRIVVDADRLIAWQLNWRGENFWSGGEIWGPFPETQTVFMKTDNQEFLAYLKDVARPKRRYFVITEAQRAKNLKGVLPEAVSKRSFQILDTSNNKFTLAAFWL